MKLLHKPPLIVPPLNPQKRIAKPIHASDFSESRRKTFWSRVQIGAPDECWPWKASRHTRGYGTFFVNQQKGVCKAHRIALVLSGVDIDPSLEATHRCDNPPCCNPAHLKPGTHHKNMLEALERGLFRPNPLRGEKHKMVKLTESDVLDIRRRLRNGEKKYQLAKLFKVNRSNIQHIAKGKTWVHLLTVEDF